MNVDYYLSDVTSYSDYYPFGMLQPNRNGGENYRYAYQGSEKDDEISGLGNTYTTHYRMLSVQNPRWWSVDPLEAKYPHYSPYQFSGNRVIDMIELEGLEPTFPKGFQETMNAYKDLLSSPIYHKNQSETSFSAADAHTLFMYYNINYQAKSDYQEDIGDGNHYGNQYTNSRLCAYDCITSAAIGVRVLNDDYKIPIKGGANGNMRVYLSNLAKDGYAGDEYELDFNRVDGEIESMKGSLAKDITVLTGGKEGYYFFGMAINEGVHSVIVGVHIAADGKTSYSFMDNTDYTRKVSSTELDEIITGWAYSLSSGSRKTYYRPLINTNFNSNESSDEASSEAEDSEGN